MKTSEPSCEIDDINNIKDEIFEKLGTYSAYKNLSNLYAVYILDLKPGEFLPRIYRPQVINQFDSLTRYQKEMMSPGEADIGLDYLPFDYETVISGITQLSLLTEELKAICRTVAPSQKN